MFSSALYIRSFRSNWKIIVLFMGVLAMYMTVIIGMFDPDNVDLVEQLAAMKLSEELLSAFGFTLSIPTLTGFISSYFYGMLMLAFPMIVSIILGNRLVASLVDKGSMAYILSTPVTRKKVAFTQCVFLLSSITAVILFVTLWGMGYCAVKFPGMLDVPTFLMINVGALLVQWAIGGICFFFSCVCNESKTSLLFGAGIPVALLLLQMLANAGESLHGLRYFTIFSLYSTADILAGKNLFVPFGAMVLIALVLYTAGIEVFHRKDLPI